MSRKAPHVRTKAVRDPLPFGPGLNAHKLVAKQAIKMAQEYFELYAIEDAWYRKMRADGLVTEKQARYVFVERIAPRLLEDARQALTFLLRLPDDQCAPSMKEEIYEALVKDNDLRAKRFVAENRATVPSMLH